jgi:hypothetical protein
MLLQNHGVLWITDEFGNGVLQNPVSRRVQGSLREGITHTLDISLKTEVWAISKRLTTSVKLFSMDASSPTARVIRLARLLRRACSMLSSHGEPGARKALYRPKADISCRTLGKRAHMKEN